MKIQNISGADREIEPRGRLGWKPGDGLTVAAGALIDLEPDVAGRPPSPEYLAELARSRRLDVDDQAGHDAHHAAVTARTEDGSFVLDRGCGLLAQHEVWGVPKPDKPKKDEEASK